AAAARLAASTDCPAVDVFICTYNEPLNVLEKSIVAALALDYPNHTVFVCDDTRRDAVRQYCAEVGAEYVTRPDNAHAKAGNLNNALRRTASGREGAPLILVLDADFAPQRQLLKRVVGLFDDPKIGVVQTPQFYYNCDPIQHNLGLRDSFVDDQRVFFDTFQPAKDAVDCAFCVGTSFVVRRDLVTALGGFPHEALSEDMLLTYRLMQEGYVTRWLNERLSVGLSAEGLAEYMTQRTRWCLGTIQIGLLKDGPVFGSGYTLTQRLHYLHGLLSWLSKPFIVLMMVAPLFYWFFDIPAFHADYLAFLHYGVPALFGYWIYSTWVSERRTLPFFTEVTHTLVALPITMTLISAIRSPFGKPFKVTEKGGDRSSVTVMVGTAATFGGLALALAVAIVLAIEGPDAQTSLPGRDLFNLVWAGVAMVTAFAAFLVCFERPRPADEERIRLDRPCATSVRSGSAVADASVTWLSAEEAIVAGPAAPSITGAAEILLPEAGWVACMPHPREPEVLRLEPTPDQRRALVAFLFSRAPENVAPQGRLLPSVLSTARSAFWR
ncbi:MAG: glycosyltransferase, partial [Pararhizobium sp.]